MNRRLVAASKKYKLIIEEEQVGWYLYVYQLSDSKCIKDYLLDTLEEAQEEAEEMYGILREDWNNYP